VLLGAWCISERAFAQQTAGLELQWQGAAECAERSALDDEIARILANAHGERRTVSARVAVAPESGAPNSAWHVELATTVGNETHERHFDAESCAAARSAIALILALAIDPLSAPSGPGPTTESSPAPSDRPVTAAAPAEHAPTITSVERDSPPEVSRSPGPAPTSAWVLAAAAGIDDGTLPRPTLGAELALGFIHDGLRVELSGSAWGARDGFSTSDDAGARFRLVSAEARAVYAWRWHQVALGPSVGFDLARLSASGFDGSSANFEQRKTIAGLGAGGLLEWRPARWFGVRAALESVFWLSRPAFVVLEPNPAPPSLVYRPAVVAGRAFLGAELDFP